MMADLADLADGSAARTHERTTVSETLIERAGAACGIALLVAMQVLVGGEVLIRNITGLSWEGTDEFGGYMLVALTFVSLPVCVARGGLHEMQILRQRLRPRGSAVLDMVLHLASLVFVALLVWQYSRLSLSAWRMGDVSTTGVQTPLWVPMATMVVGSFALGTTLLRLIVADARRLARIARG